MANVHLDAVEHKDRIVFLHRLEGGPADRSYGIHVAHLAGIPKDVVRAARQHLAELEKQLRPARRAARSLRAPPHAPQPAAAPTRCATRSPRSSPTSSRRKDALEALYRLEGARG